MKFKFMLLPWNYSEPYDEKKIYKKKCDSLLRTARKFNQRVSLFILDLSKSDLTSGDKKSILKELHKISGPDGNLLFRTEVDEFFKNGAKKN